MSETGVKFDFPLYRMYIDGDEYWLSLTRAGIVYDDGFRQVEIGGAVLDSPGRVRLITDSERKKIAQIAEDWSAMR